MKIYRVFLCFFVITTILSCQMTNLSNNENLNQEERNNISEIVSVVNDEIKENIRKVNVFKIDDAIIEKAKVAFNMKDSFIIDEYSTKIIKTDGKNITLDYKQNSMLYLNNIQNEGEESIKLSEKISDEVLDVAEKKINKLEINIYGEYQIITGYAHIDKVDFNGGLIERKLTENIVTYKRTYKGNKIIGQSGILSINIKSDGNVKNCYINWWDLTEITESSPFTKVLSPKDGIEKVNDIINRYKKAGIDEITIDSEEQLYNIIEKEGEYWLIPCMNVMLNINGQKVNHIINLAE